MPRSLLYINIHKAVFEHFVPYGQGRPEICGAQGRIKLWGLKSILSVAYIIYIGKKGKGAKRLKNKVLTISYTIFD